MTKSNRKSVIRKHGLTVDLYLSRNGQWVDYKNAARCSSDAAIDKLAKKFNIADDSYGVFPG